MLFHPFEITAPHIVYALLGAFIVLFGMFSLLLREKLYIGEAIWAFLFGIIIGPYGANVFDPRAWSHNSEEVTNVITLEFTRVVLAIGVFAIGVELPKAYMAKHKRSLFFLLVPVMTWGWFVSAALIFALIPSLNFLSSLAVAACLTPTDPILAAAVVGGKWADKHVPAHIRHLLAAESGCNDGAAFPFLFLALYLMISDGHPALAVRDWFLKLWLYQVILGAIIGALLGYAFRHLMKFCERRNLIDRHSYVAQYISLAILTIGICTLLGSDDLLAAFCCGTAFAWDGFFNRQTEESSFSSVIDLLFNIAAFIYVGAWMPFNKFQDAELTITVWRLIVIAILVLILRRLPVMIMCYKWIPDIKTFREALFAGHFGPIGVGAVFISTLAVEVLHNAHKDDDEQIHLVMETIQPIVGFMVLCSIAVHGMSIPGFSLGRRVHSVSRTWSRRDTGHSATPDWAHSTRIVTRGEDIVINRDRLDPERGGLTVVHELKKAPSATSSSNEKPRTLTGSDARDDLAQGPTSGTPPAPDYREETPPDGTDVLSEWVEGHHRVIERRAGPGDDVEVIVINENPNAPDAFVSQTKWRGARHDYLKDAHQIGQSIRAELQTLGHKAREVISITPRHSKDQLKRHQSDDKIPSATAYENAVDDEDDDEDGWASDSGSVNNDSSNNVVSHPSPTSSSPPRRRVSRPGKPFVVHAHRPGSTRRPSFRRNSIDLSKDEIVEVPRGRETRPTTASSTVSLSSASVLHSSASFGKMGASGSMGQSRHSRPGTADSASGRYGSGHHVRPGTGDSARHVRIEGIRQIHGRNTRESSPSRSVRFVDTEGGRSGLVSRASVNELFAKSVMDSPVDEEPTPSKERT